MATPYDQPRYVTREHFQHVIHELYERIDQMASQADIDTLTAQINQVSTDLASAQSTLQAEIDQLASANPQLDLTALQAAVAPVDQAVQSLAALKPTPPAPPAA